MSPWDASHRAGRASAHFYFGDAVGVLSPEGREHFPGHCLLARGQLGRDASVDSSPGGRFLLLPWCLVTWSPSCLLIDVATTGHTAAPGSFDSWTSCLPQRWGGGRLIYRPAVLTGRTSASAPCSAFGSGRDGGDRGRWAWRVALVSLSLSLPGCSLAAETGRSPSRGESDEAHLRVCSTPCRRFSANDRTCQVAGGLVAVDSLRTLRAHCGAAFSACVGGSSSSPGHRAEARGSQWRMWQP